jgi:hypothetical protein
MKRVYNAKSPALVFMYNSLQVLFKENPLISWRFLHIPREMNQWADFLSQVANKLEDSFSLD